MNAAQAGCWSGVVFVPQSCDKSDKPKPPPAESPTIATRSKPSAHSPE